MATEGMVDGAGGESIGQSIDTASDASLVRDMIQGSQQAVAGLYDRHGGAVFAAAMRASRDRAIAEEVVQETFLTLWDRAELFDPSRGSLAAWLATIARHRAIDRLRAATRHERASSFSTFARAEEDDHSVVEWLMASGELIGTARPETLPEVALTAKETRASITEALASLDPVELRVIVLAYDAGLTQSEIAVSLGWPIGTVKTRTRRALRRLRDRLELPGSGSPTAPTAPTRATRTAIRSAHADLPAARLGGCLAPC